MKTDKLKSKWHRLVDKMVDDRYWAALYKSVKETNAELKNSPQVDIVHELTTVQYKSLKKAIKQLDEGKGIPHEDVMKNMRKKWLGK